MPKKVDYNKLKIEYITGDISYQDLADKYGIARSTLQKKACKEGWYKEKIEHGRNVVDKAVRKVANEQASIFAKELKCLDKIQEVLNKALNDAEQFNLQVVQRREKYKKPVEIKGKLISEQQWVEEIVGRKIDMKSLKEAAESLKLVEQMKRSMSGILSIEQQKSLEMQSERLQLEKRRVDQGEVDNEVKVIFASPEIEDEGWAD